MKKLALILVTLLAAALWLGGCTQKSEEPSRIIENLVVSPEALVVANAVDTAYFQVKADDRWSAESDADWLTPYPEHGSLDAALAVFVTANTGSERTGTVTITAPGHYPPSVTVRVRQLTLPPLKVHPTHISAAYTDQSASFHIIATYDWHVEENLDWITVSPDSGVGNSELVCNFGVNEGDSRQAVISLFAPGHYPTSLLVSISQAAKPPELKVIPEHREVEHDVTASAFSIFAKGPWSITKEGDWFGVIPLEGGGNDYIRVIFDANTSIERRGTITIYAPEHLPERVTVSLTQKSSPSSVPSAPSGLVKRSIFWDALELSWNDVGANELGYSIEYLEEGLGAWQTAGQTPVDVTSFLIENLRPETNYSARVIAFNGFGLSAPSPLLAFRTASDIVELPFGGDPVQGVISPSNDHDWYRCVSERDGHCRFKVHLINLTDSEMWLYGPDDRTRERLYDDNSGEGNASQIDAWLPGGAYYLCIGAHGESETGTYTSSFTAGS